MRIPAALFVLASLSGCDTGMTMGEAEDHVRALLRDPSSAEFTEETRYPETKDHGVIVCGMVNAKNGFGGMTGPRRFISGGQTIIEDPTSAVDAEIFGPVWEKSCKP